MSRVANPLWQACKTLVLDMSLGVRHQEELRPSSVHCQATCLHSRVYLADRSAVVFFTESASALATPQKLKAPLCCSESASTSPLEVCRLA